MKINNDFSPERIKKALSTRTVAIVFLIVTVLSIVFYVTIENYHSREVTIWFVTTDAEASFPNEILDKINDYAQEKGIDRVLIIKRHPEDQYFDAVLSTGAFYNCDAFIMKEDVALKYAEMDMFSALSTDNGELLYVDDEAVGVLLEDNYYFLINKKTDIDREIMYDIYEILVRQENK